MNPSRIRLITFDVSNTLLQYRSSAGKQYGEIGAMYGVFCDNHSLNANFETHWQKMIKEHPNFGRKSGLGWEKWWKMLVIGTFKDSKFNLDEKKLEVIACHLIDIYETSTCWHQSYGAFGLLSYLRNRCIPMGIISNFDPRLQNTLVNTKLRHYFDFLVASYEMEVEKPHTEIFDKAMEASRLKELNPENCVHVGDSVALDYLGARNSGWNGVLIKDMPFARLKKKHPELDENHFFRTLYDYHRCLVENDEKSRISAISG